MPEVFAGLSIFSLVAAFALSSLFCLFQPIWSIVDCIDSDRERETKVLVSVAILLTWGVGSLVYGFFFTKSRNLRWFTIVTSLVMVGLVVLMVSSFISAIATHAKRVEVEQELQQAAVRERIEAFSVPLVPADAVAPFYALAISRTGRHSSVTSLAEFTLAGAIGRSARDVRGGVRDVAHDAKRNRTFALTQHAFGALSPASGEFIEIAFDPGVEASWPKGIAWDSEEEKVIVMTSHVYSRFLKYDPETLVWEALATKIRDLSMVGLAYVPETDEFYSIADPAHGTEVATLLRFNRTGALLGRVSLVPAIPVNEDGTFQPQLHASSGKLVLMLPALAAPGPDGGTAESAVPLGAPDRIFLVDPASGAVSAHSALAPVAAALE